MRAWNITLHKWAAMVIKYTKNSNKYNKNNKMVHYNIQHTDQAYFFLTLNIQYPGKLQVCLSVRGLLVDTRH